MFVCLFVCVRQWCDEPQEGLGEGPGAGRLSGLVVQKERKQRALGLEVEEVLVRAEEMFAVLVRIRDGKLCGFPVVMCTSATENVNCVYQDLLCNVEVNIMSFLCSS